MWWKIQRCVYLIRMTPNWSDSSDAFQDKMTDHCVLS